MNSQTIGRWSPVTNEEIRKAVAPRDAAVLFVRGIEGEALARTLRLKGFDVKLPIMMGFSTGSTSIQSV